MKPIFPTSVLVYTDGEVIGDGIIRLPFAAALKEAFPEVTLTWLASGYSVFGTALKDLAQPVIDDVVIIPHRRLPLSDFIRRPAPVRGRRFDIVIETQRKVKRSAWLKRVNHRLFVSAAANGRLSDVALPSRQDRFIDQLLAMAAAAAGVTLTPKPIALADPSWEQAARNVLPEGQRYIGFVVGAGHPDKCWPLDRFIALAQTQLERGRIPVIFLGPQEGALAETLRVALPNAILPLTESNGVSIDRGHACYTIALGSRLALTVANDSGGGHLIAAGGSPMLSLFRSGTVRKKFLPTATRVEALAPEDFAGTMMADIPLQAVESTLEKMLG